MAKVTNLVIDIQSGTTNTLYAAWSFSKNHVDHYTVTWTYYTGDGVGFRGEQSDVDVKNDTYNIPDNATKVKVTVKPVSKTKTVNGKQVSYWSSESVSQTWNVSWNPPEKPSSPDVTVEKYKLTAIVDDVDTKAEYVGFEVYKNNKKFKTGESKVKAQQASFSCDIVSGAKYKVRCRALNKTRIKSGKIVLRTLFEFSEWSDYSSEVETIPNTPMNVKSTMDSETSVKISWTKSTGATNYEVEYTTDKTRFDHSDEVSSKTFDDVSYGFITGLESGDEYFFRVRATNDRGESGWSSIVSQIIGSTPEAPTTWSSSTTAKVGEEVILYWTHNSEDGSKQTTSQIEITVNGKSNIITKTYTVDEDEEEETVYSHTLDMSAYSEGAEILWRVRTKGIMADYSEWSTQRTIDLYAPPTLSLSVDDPMTTYPCLLTVEAGPDTQTPVSYHFSIIAEESYDSVDVNGEDAYVSAGTEVYSRVVISSNRAWSLALEPSAITLQNGVTYRVTATVSMGSGLTAEDTITFTTSWADDTYEPDAEIGIDEDTISAYISPYCLDENGDYISDVTLSVYRREYDGSFTEIATDIVNNGAFTVTDPHPALDYARYRIVAINRTNGNIGYSDIPGYPVDEHSIIIQWDEAWSEFDYEGEDEFDEPPWTGSMLKLPYNVDVSESRDKDTSLIEYIGREHPVSYYGTHLGEKANWSTVIPKDDIETIYALRRLSVWQGDVYVREPSGVGYWAQISVSMSIKHLELTVPVSFDIVRVEGGM